MNRPVPIRNIALSLRKSSHKNKAGHRWLHWWILSNIWGKSNTNPIHFQKVKEITFHNPFYETRYQSQAKTGQEKKIIVQNPS